MTPWTQGSSVHGILQARKLEWIAMLLSRGSSPPREDFYLRTIQFSRLPKSEIKSSSTPPFLLLFFNRVLIFYLFILAALGLCSAAYGLSLVAASRGYSSLQRLVFSLWRLPLWQSKARGCEGSVVVAQGLRCSAVCGIFPG